MKNKHLHPSAKSLALGLVAAAALAAGSSANAALVFTLTETGSGLTLTGSGSFNFGGSLSLLSGPFRTHVTPEPVTAGLTVGPTIPNSSDPTHSYAQGAVVSGPNGFGPGSGLYGNPTTTGDTFGFAPGSLTTKGVFLPLGYTSGTALNGETFWAGETLASLGATPGTYEWNTSYGGVDDTITLTITAVPEPSTFALIGLAGLGVLRRRRCLLR